MSTKTAKIYEDFKLILRCKLHNGVTFKPLPNIVFARVHRDSVKVIVSSDANPTLRKETLVTMDEIVDNYHKVAVLIANTMITVFNAKWDMERGVYKRRGMSLHQHEGLDNDPID